MARKAEVAEVVEVKGLKVQVSNAIQPDSEISAKEGTTID